MPNKILIVDDEPFNLDLLEQELEDQGYVIERANDGAEALEKVPSFEPDVILLDYMMPKMNGLEVLRHLREDEKYKRIPVILLTAKATQEDKVRGLDAGADDYVIKPFDSFDSWRGCERWCGSRRCMTPWMNGIALSLKRSKSKSKSYNG